MTIRTELLEIISNGKNSGVEFKRDNISPQVFVKELVAFLNLDGGRMLLGVEDDGTVTGLMRPNIEEWAMNVCRDKIRPPIIPYFEMIRGNSKTADIAVVRVTCGYDVHSLWENNSNKYLIRVGTQGREASKEELSRLFQQRESVGAELCPVSGATVEHLDQMRLKNYFGDIRRQTIPKDKDQNVWQKVFFNTGFIAEDGITVGGMLLFGNTPNRFLPHAGIDAVAHVGTEKDYHAKERATLRGPMTPLLSEDGHIVENGFVEQALEFVKRNVHGAVKAMGGRREVRPVYPPDVIREGIVNALIHRDYLLTSTDIGLDIFDDRLEIMSPSKLPNGITTERMRSGVRASRNQLLKDVMRDYNYLECMGMGILRKVIKGMQEHNGKDPELVESDKRFILRLFA